MVAVTGGIAGMSAFEAHVINVTAKIENALFVPTQELEFGTVFPQEAFDKTFDVRLSDSFQEEGRVDDIEYVLRQKPKCADDPDNPKEFSQVTEEGGVFKCKNPDHEMLPLLCPYLSKSEITQDGQETENDGEPIKAFHGLPGDWTLATTLANQVKGKLIKSAQDISDTWNIDLKVPCFGNHCAQDWEEFVLGINASSTPADYVQPIENNHKVFGCDLWLEVFGVSLPPTIGCEEKADVMLVLDRSGSIDDPEEATLKTAAKAFVDALAPSADTAHLGQSSFGTTGSLDVHLTEVGATVKAAIDALTTPDESFTNLKEGIELAKGELDNPGDGHDRADGDSPDFMVIITDGAPNRPVPATAEADAKAAADAAKAAGVTIFVVGVGTTADTALFLKDDIASSAAHYFDAADFGALEAILKALVDCP